MPEERERILIKYEDLRLQNGELTLPRSYIYCARIAPGIPSVLLPNGPKAKGATTRLTPVIRRMSPRPKRSPFYCRRSQLGRHRTVEAPKAAP
jgi:hypothetical protein